MRKIRLLVIICIAIIALVAFFSFKYKKYKREKELFSSIVWYSFDDLFKDYSKISNDLLDKKKFNNFLDTTVKHQHFKSVFNTLNYKYNIINKNDTLYFYLYGFDGDDKCDNIYMKRIDQVSFWQSFFFDADLLILKEPLESNNKQIEK